MPRAHLTRFTAISVPHVRVDALCFGAPMRVASKCGRVVYPFRPGQVFGVVWWRRFNDGRQHRAVAIVQALDRIQAGHHIPGIEQPVAVHSILDQHGPAGQDGAVDCLLDFIRDMKRRGQKPEQMPAKDWVEVSIRILLSSSPISDKEQCSSLSDGL